MKDLVDEIQRLAKIIENSGADEDDLEIFETFLAKTIELRNRLEKKMKYSSPTKQKILRLQVIDLDNRIAQYKQKFNKYEDICQEEKLVEKKYEQKLDKLFDEADLQVAKMYIIAKHQMPKDFFEGLHASIVESLTPELEQEFFDRIAHLEATQLNEILEGKQ